MLGRPLDGLARKKLSFDWFDGGSRTLITFRPNLAWYRFNTTKKDGTTNQIVKEKRQKTENNSNEASHDQHHQTKHKTTINDFYVVMN